MKECTEERKHLRSLNPAHAGCKALRTSLGSFLFSNRMPKFPLRALHYMRVTYVFGCPITFLAHSASIPRLKAFDASIKVGKKVRSMASSYRGNKAKVALFPHCKITHESGTQPTQAGWVVLLLMWKPLETKEVVAYYLGMAISTLDHVTAVNSVVMGTMNKWDIQ